MHAHLLFWGVNENLREDLVYGFETNIEVTPLSAVQGLLTKDKFYSPIHKCDITASVDWDTSIII